MKTLIAYATKHGAAKNCAQKLAEKLEGDVDLVNLKRRRDIDLADYDRAVIGSSVYMSRIRKEARKFCQAREDELVNMVTGYFLCCMREGEDAVEQMKENFSGELLNSAVATGIFGGEFKFDDMNFLERLIIKVVRGTDESESNIKEEEINQFAEEMNRS